MKGRSFVVILRHRVVEVMTLVVFTIGGVKSGIRVLVSIVIANFIKIRNKKFKVIIQLMIQLLFFLKSRVL